MACLHDDDITTVQNFVLPQRYYNFEKQIRDFQVLDSDVWLLGYPKTGTTWMSEIAWLIANDFDYEGAQKMDTERNRLLEFTMFYDRDLLANYSKDEWLLNSVEYAGLQKEPRTIRSHLPFPLLPQQIVNGTKKPRIIYTARNPMDTCVSYCHHATNYHRFRGTVEEFSKLFLNDKVDFTPYADHVLSFWEHRHEPNILFITYEEMKNNLSGVINNMAKLLGKNITEEDNQRLQKHVSFDSMKSNPFVNKENHRKQMSQVLHSTPFIRSGKVGGYKSFMSPEIIQEFRSRIGKRFEGSGLNIMDY